VKPLSPLVVGVLIIGCSPSEDHIRNAVRAEIGKAMNRTIIAPTTTIGPYSPAVQVGDFLFVSGQIGLDQETGQLKSETIEAETQQALDNIKTILEAAGYAPMHVVSATVYLRAMDDFQRMNDVYAKFFPEGKYPARTTVAVSELPKHANVEIAVVACKTK
jgi:2-iminobutanoate/2-iminopropanoate deaminase